MNASRKAFASSSFLCKASISLRALAISRSLVIFVRSSGLKRSLIACLASLVAFHRSRRSAAILSLALTATAAHDTGPLHKLRVKSLGPAEYSYIAERSHQLIRIERRE